jgi:hypothetical protein
MKTFVMLLLFCVAGKAALGVDARPLGPTGPMMLHAGPGMAAPQAQKPSVVEQSRLVSPKDAINGADWLKAEGIPQGLDQLDFGADEKGRPIKFQFSGNRDSGNGGGIQIKLTGSGLDTALVGDKANSGIMGKFRKKNDSAKGASGLTVTDLFGPHFARSDQESKGSAAAESANKTTGNLSKLNQMLGGGKDHYLVGTNLYPPDLRILEQNAPVIKLLAEGKPDEANKLYSSLHAGDAGADLGTSDPTKLALIQNVNATMDDLTNQEQTGAKTLHFKAEGGNIVAHLDDQQTANIDTVLQSMGSDSLFGTGQFTYQKDAAGKGLVAVGSSISSSDAAKAAAPLKIAIDTGDAKQVKAYQKYKGLNDLNLPKR